MAEITQGGGHKNAGGKVRAKRLSTRIDMTPMVDLAFLLLTFFILTSTFNRFRAMDLTMPDKTELEPPMRLHEDDALSVALTANNKVHWWIGSRPAVTTDFSSKGIRKILIEKNKANPKLMVLIKPADDSRYENMVDILDELEITNTQRYAIVEFTEDDRAWVRDDR